MTLIPSRPVGNASGIGHTRGQDVPVMAVLAATPQGGGAPPVM